MKKLQDPEKFPETVFIFSRNHFFKQFTPLLKKEVAGVDIVLNASGGLQE